MTTMLRMLTGVVAFAVLPARLVLRALVRAIARPKTMDQRAAEWLHDSNGVGASARTIYDVLTGHTPASTEVRARNLGHVRWSWDAPYDADDFGRCARLLERVPEWTSRLDEVANACSAFRRLVRCWPELTRLHESGDTALLTAVIGDLRDMDDAPIRMTVRRQWEMIDARPDGDTCGHFLPIGTHDMERIINPLDYSGYWLVLKGTRLGASEGSWRQWAGHEDCSHWIEREDDYLITFGKEHT